MNIDTDLLLFGLPLLLAWALDIIFGDPLWLPHPVVLFGKLISWGEKILNKGAYRKIKGILLVVTLTTATYLSIFILLYVVKSYNGGAFLLITTLLIFYCLAGTTLIREVKDVFIALDTSLEKGRLQVARIVGRDTSQLTAQEVRTAALETLAENLSDGVIAPLFWYFLLGIPGMMTYKMINTLDSMIGYKSERYASFGWAAAKMDDLANFIPARITALLMIIATGRLNLLLFTIRYGREHASPNAGYPEAALAGILNCQFGGPHNYFGKEVWKPYIGYNPRELTTEDMTYAIRINRRVETIMILYYIILLLL